MAWPAIAIFAAKLFVVMAISYLLRPKQKYNSPKPAGIDQFKITTATVGREFPTLFGCKKLTSPNIVWYGDLGVDKITQKVSSGLFSSKKVTVGYRYSLGIHMVWAHDIDSISKIEIDNKIAYEDTWTDGTITIDEKQLFGGDNGGGGIAGDVTFLPGGPTQTANAYLVEQLGSDMPAFRGVASMVLEHVYLGTSEYLKEWHIWAKKIYNDWYPAKAAIGNDMNPAHIIYETLTNRRWGMGEDPNSIDDAAFTAAADTLYTEGFGMSLVWDYSTSIEDFIVEILTHIDASLYIDINSGKLVLKLIRADYDVETLPLFDEDNIVEITQFKRHAIEDIANTVTVKYWDGETGEDGSITRSDIALVARTGRSSVTTIDYPGITSTALADYVVNRDLHALSMPLANAIIVTTTEGLQLSPGSPFLFSWELYGITQMVMRVTSVKYGEFGDSRITIECTEDVFGISDSIYTAPPPTGWEPIGTDPTVSPLMIAWELPYKLLLQTMGPSEVQALIDLGDSLDVIYGIVGIMGVKPTEDAYSANAAYKLNSSDSDRDKTVLRYYDLDPPYWATANGAVTRSQTVIPVTWENGEYDVQQGMWCAFVAWGAVGGEIAYVSGVNTTSHTVTLLRGCCDTVPVAYPTGYNMIFFDVFPHCELPFLEDDSVICWWRPVTTRGVDDSNYVYPSGSSDVVVASIDGRLFKPAPPGRIRINGSVDPTSITDGATITVTWKTRNVREPYSSLIYHELNEDITPSDAFTYKVLLYNYDDGIVDPDTFITSKSVSPGTGTISFTAEEIVFDEEPFSGEIYVQIYAENRTGRVSAYYTHHFAYEQAEE